MGLPSLTVAWQPTPRCGLRLRARGVAGGIDDFQLLNPQEVFLFDTADLPTLWLVDLANGNVTGRGDSEEAEFDYTFHDSSFFRIGLLNQQVRNTYDVDSEYLRESTFRSLNLQLEKVLTPTISGFIGDTIIDTHADTEIADGQYSSGTAISDVPHYEGELGLQYLNPRGWFMQQEVAVIGSRLHSYDYGTNTPRVPANAFMDMNLRFGKHVGLRTTYFIEVDNLFNQTLTLFGGNSEQLLPGRQITAGFSQRF